MTQNQNKWFNIDWKDYASELIKYIQTENWGNNNKILVNYMAHTIKKLKSDKQIQFTDKYAIINTGLFNEFYEPIYAHQDKDNKITFGDSYKMSILGVDDLPNRANYFTQPELLLFDWHYEVRVQMTHILKDKNNNDRLPNDLAQKKNIHIILNGAIEDAKRKVVANYKLAIPQYFEDNIQLLLPLYLQNEDKPDLALVLTKNNNYYLAHTCITLDMAYNNVRLIAKPESNWLRP